MFSVTSGDFPEVVMFKLWKQIVSLIKLPSGPTH